MDPISELNEFCQRNRCGPPKYTHTRAGGPDHLPLWTCTIDLCGEQFASQPNASKAEAKREAAALWNDAHRPLVRYAAPKYTQAPCPTTLPLPEAPAAPAPDAQAQHHVAELDLDDCDFADHVILVDAENVQGNGLEAIADARFPVRAYCAEKWPALDVMQRRFGQFDWRVAKSGHKDAADVLMIVDTVLLLTQRKYVVMIGGDGIHKTTSAELKWHPLLGSAATSFLKHLVRVPPVGLRRALAQPRF